MAPRYAFVQKRVWRRASNTEFRCRFGEGLGPVGSECWCAGGQLERSRPRVKESKSFSEVALLQDRPRRAIHLFHEAMHGRLKVLAIAIVHIDMHVVRVRPDQMPQELAFLCRPELLDEGRLERPGWADAESVGQG